jgi:hypothetical protein
MFGRRKNGQSATPAVQERVGAKNRPTPKRSVAQAANKRPLVPTDRKVAGKSSREQVRTQRNLQRAAMLNGDERHLPARDQGAEKRFIRDYVDARYSVGEFLLPVVAIVFLATITRLPIAVFATTIIVYGVILAVLVDSLLLRRRINQALTAKFGSAPKGVGFYAVTRTLQIRRWRMPRPQVARGQYPS